MSRRVGRPQGRPRGRTRQANALAEFLLTLTAGTTLRELAGRYHVGKTLWGEYRSGEKIIPLDLLRRLVLDTAPDEPTRRAHLKTAERLHTAAVEGTSPAPGPVVAPEPARPEPAGRGRSLLLAGGGAVAVVVAVLALLAGLSPANTPPPEVFATGPGGHGVFRWDGGDATGWTRIGAGAKALRAGPVGRARVGRPG